MKREALLVEFLRRPLRVVILTYLHFMFRPFLCNNWDFWCKGCKIRGCYNMHDLLACLTFEPRHEKTCVLGV